MEGKVIVTTTAKDGTPLVLRYPTLDDVQAMLDYINTLSKEKTFIRLQGEQLTYEFEGHASCPGSNQRTIIVLT